MNARNNLGGNNMLNGNFGIQDKYNQQNYIQVNFECENE